MNLNPLTAIAKVAGNAWGTYQERRSQAKKIEGELSKDKLEYKRAKIKAKTEYLLNQRKMDNSYDMQVLKNRQTTWLDEALGIAIIVMTALAFVPGTAEYIKAGWEAVSAAPFWFQFAWYVLITSTLGGLTVLRILVGSGIRSTMGKGKDVMEKGVEATKGASMLPMSDDESTSSESPRGTSRQSPEQNEMPRKEEQESSPKEKRDESSEYPFRRPGPPGGGGR